MEFIKSINYQGTGRPIAADYDGSGNLIKDTYASQDSVNKSIDDLQKAIDAGGTAAIINITETTSSTYAKAYIVKQGTKEIGTINIPKDMVVSSGSLKTVTSADVPYTGAKVGDKYIDLVIANSSSEHIYIPVSDLIDTYTAGNGLTLSDSKFSVKINDAGDSYLTVDSDGIKLSGVEAALNNKVDKDSKKDLVLSTEITKLALLPNKTDLDNSIASAKASGDNAQSSIDAHKKDTDNPHSVTKSLVGLGNVDNTSDKNKPISTATLTALDNKVDKEDGKSLSTNDYTTAEKTKLSGIAENANNYSLPTASASTLGGIKVGTNLSINDGVLSSAYSTATTSADGLMSKSDKTKLNGIAENANNYTLPTASTTTLGGVVVDESLSDTVNPVLNKAVKTAIDEINSQLSWAKID